MQTKNQLIKDTPPRDRSKLKKIIIVLSCGFSALSVASVTSIFKLVNDVIGWSCIQIEFLVLGDKSAKSSCGFTIFSNVKLINYDEFFSLNHRPNAVFFCLGGIAKDTLNISALRTIRASLKYNVPIYSLGEEKELLLKENMIKSSAWHWSRARVVAEKYPNHIVQEIFFETDNRITTCAGGIASIDITLAFVRNEFGDELTEKVCHHLLVRFPRKKSCLQPNTHSLEAGSTVLKKAVKVMINNLEDPLDICDLATLLKVSQRQLERTFKKYVKTSPAKYYKHLRLELATQLLEETEMSIWEIAVATGFSSASIFSENYEICFGVKPTQLNNL